MLASILDPLYTLMGYILAFIYGIVPNYIVAISGMTVLVLTLLTPLTLKGLRSQITMQKLQPEVKRLQAEYKDDRVAMNEAVMALYKEHGANPISGCLPFIVQSPFFFALFGVLRGISHVEYRATVEGAPYTDWAIVTDKAKFHDPGVLKIATPKHIPVGSKLYDSLFGVGGTPPAKSGLPPLAHNAGEVKAWGFDLAKSASEAVKQGFTTFLPYFALVVAMILLQVFAQQQITKRNPQAAAANPQMQLINKVFPFLFGIWGWAFQAGLTLYWTVSAALRIIQQTVLYRFDPKLAESVRERKAELERDVKKAVTKKGPAKTPSKKNDSSKSKPAQKDKKSADRVLKPAPQAATGGAPKPNPGRQQPKKRRKGR